MHAELNATIVSLFPVLDEKLITLLRSLDRNDWNKPTIAKQWTVKDIAAHLLDGNIRTLSLSRDQHHLAPDRNINNYHELVDYLNNLNADWVRAMKRMSPEVLIELLEITGREYSNYIATLNPHMDAIFSVAWAGEHVSKNWFHIAREYTEKWHHQQQIREATGKPGISSKHLYFPVIDTFMQGLPHTFRDIRAENETNIAIIVESDAGGKWFLNHINNQWKLSDTHAGEVNGSITIPAEIAWKVFTKGIPFNEARELCVVEGNKELASNVLKLVAIMG